MAEVKKDYTIAKSWSPKFLVAGKYEIDFSKNDKTSKCLFASLIVLVSVSSTRLYTKVQTRYLFSIYSFNVAHLFILL